MLSAGDRLGPYEVVAPLGAGGMGVVYRARDTKLSRDVALKVLPQGALADEAARKRFRKEALALSRLSHPHVASLFDFDTTEGGLDFLVMELVPGPSLDTKLKHGPLPEKDVVRLGAQVARALVAAHEQGVLHRDLKPQNVRLTADGLAKVLDFGLARVAPALGDGATTDTASGSIAGTPPYMSPEQLLGREVDERTDVYAAGVMLYEMATGRRPFGETSGPQLVAKILNEAAPAPREANPALSPVLEQVILKATDRDKDLRHPSARELLVDLERLQAGLAPSSTGSSGRRAPSRAGALAKRRRLALGALAAVLLVGGLGAAVIGLLRPRHPRITATRTLVRGGGGFGLQTDGVDVYYSFAGRVMAVALAGGVPHEVPVPWSGPPGTRICGLRDDPKILLLLRGTDLWHLPLTGGAPLRVEGLPPVVDAAWSPGGDRLAWVETGERADVLWVGDAAGGSRRRLAEAGKDVRGGRSLWLTGWHPSGDRLRYLPRGSERFLDVGAAGGAPREAGLDLEESLWGTGAWSADGTLFLHGSTRGLLAFPEGRGRRSRGQAIPLGGPTHTMWARPTPDGRRLVAWVNRPATEVVRVDPQTRALSPLLAGASTGALAFSPDGTRVAWVANDPGGFRLWTGRPDGSERLPLGDRDVDPDTPLSWSPDGRWVAFSSWEGRAIVNQRYRLQLGSLAEGTVEALTTEDAGRDQVDPCWSPDGRWLAYGPSPTNGLPRDEEIDLRRVDLDTRRVSRIEGSEGLWAPKCAPDGRILASDELAARRAGNPGPGSPAPRLFYKLRDPATGRWTPLVVEMASSAESGKGYLFYPTWSHGARHLYAYRFPERQVVRLDPASGLLATVLDVSGLGETSVWLGLDPSDAPILHRDASVREIVVMDSRRSEETGAVRPANAIPRGRSQGNPAARRRRHPPAATGERGASSRGRPGASAATPGP